MDRILFRMSFQKESLPNWICPTCYKGRLLLKKDSFYSHETNSSVEDHENSYWDPEWIKYMYSCLLYCSSCKEIVASSGTGSIVGINDYDDNGQPADNRYLSLYKPKYFIPHLYIFKYPKNTPQEVKEELNSSFELYFCNPSASLGHVRRALEALLDCLCVKRFGRRENKRTLLNMHSRIDLLKGKYEKYKELLFAIKWLGNAGSHIRNKVTENDVLDAYEIMEETLNKLYEMKDERVLSLAKKINRKKGPKE